REAAGRAPARACRVPPGTGAPRVDARLARHAGSADVAVVKDCTRAGRTRRERADRAQPGGIPHRGAGADVAQPRGGITRPDRLRCHCWCQHSPMSLAVRPRYGGHPLPGRRDGPDRHAILNSTSEPRRSPGRQVLALLTNPIVAGSALGLILAATGVRLTRPVADPLHLLADLAIPTVLRPSCMPTGSWAPPQSRLCW